MSVRLVQCPACSSTNVGTEKLHNPDTHDLNCDATLRCEDCGKQFEGRVTSPRTERAQKQGWLR